jgi:hypothetical protein
MKLAIVYDKNDHKLSPNSYSQTYRHMFDALINQADLVQHVTENCSAKDIEADIIVVYDIHSSHHIEIDDLRNHSAVKYTYINDPHQLEMRGRYLDETPVFKLGAEARVARILHRGIDYIICPYTDGYYQFLAPYLGKDANKMHVWFPVAPKEQSFNDKRLVDRRSAVLGTGHLWQGRDDFKPYKFRLWAYTQKNVEYVKHCLHDKRIPKGNYFLHLLSQWAGALALTDNYVVPKYLEIPLAGCVCFAQYHEDYKNMGFKHGLNCIIVDEANFEDEIILFTNNVGSSHYQSVANAGQQLIKENWTSVHFAEYIYNHCKQHM